MLIEFRVENHRSLRDEQVLTLEAAPVGDESDPRPRTLDGHDVALLPAAALYGANASGKSNVLSAIGFLRQAVLFSYWMREPEQGVTRTPFAWGEKHKEPSTFEATFLIDATKYQYGFVVSEGAVAEEWLYAWPKNGKQVWLERDGDQFKFGGNLTGPNEIIKGETRRNTLFLSTASKHKHPQLLPIYNWFFDMHLVNVQGHQRSDEFNELLSARHLSDYSGRPPEQPAFHSVDNVELMKDRVRLLLTNADTGIVDVKIVSEEEEDARGLSSQRILLKHQADNDESWLSLDEESQGTRMLFRMARPILEVLHSGGRLVVDELESSLHPNLGLSIVEMFNCPKTNPNNAQIIFSTHDTNLLGTTLGEAPLRRDQIWFTEKDADGASRLYPLTDYRPRKVENLERGYLQGRYGAIPFLGNLTQIAE